MLFTTTPGQHLSVIMNLYCSGKNPEIGCDHPYGRTTSYDFESLSTRWLTKEKLALGCPLKASSGTEERFIPSTSTASLRERTDLLRDKIYIVAQAWTCEVIKRIL